MVPPDLCRTPMIALSTCSARCPLTMCALNRTYTMENQKFLSVKQVATRYGVSVPTVWNWARDGRIPAPIKISTCCTRWRLGDLEASEAAR
ncbi:helix-turn-helix transcriptional regulator [Salinicola sp. V024]|uniref:helix-turn-helix transcriptional regulator n=1 Tax=Salinicola sp. V024 TaxID=3459609 RepID=UPI004043FC34